LLDTNVLIAILNDRPACVRARFIHEIKRESRLYLSAIVEFELRYGIAKSTQTEQNEEKLSLLLRSPLLRLPFDFEDATSAGPIRALLEKQGNPIGAYDVQIAGQAVRRELTLVTANVAEFKRVPNIKIVDWTASEKTKRKSTRE